MIRHKLWDLNRLPERRPGRKTPLTRQQMVYILSNPTIPPRVLARKYAVSERAIRRVRESRFIGSIPTYRCPVCFGPSIGRMLHRGCERRADPAQRALAKQLEHSLRCI